MKKGQKLISKYKKGCYYCGKIFNSTRIDAKFCSTSCRNAVSIQKSKKSVPNKSLIFNLPSLWEIETSGLEERHIRFILKKRSLSKLKEFVSISKRIGFKRLNEAIDIFGYKFKENENDCRKNNNPKEINKNIISTPNDYGIGQTGIIIDSIINKKPIHIRKPTSSENPNE
jgi:hypothetical protein